MTRGESAVTLPGMDPEKEVWLVSNGDYWKAVWTNAAGERQAKSIGAKAKYSRRQARILARRLAAESNGEKSDAGPLLSAWLTTFAESRDVGAKTTAGYREAGFYLRAFFDDDPPIGEIERADAAQWRDDLASAKLTAKMNTMGMTDPAWKNASTGTWIKPSASTVAKHVRAAKLIFQEAADRDLITFNPFDRLKAGTPKIKKTWKQVSADETKRILEACPSPAWRILFALCRWAGLRLGEAMRLKWADVDWAGNRMTIDGDLEEETTKRRMRVVPIEPARCPSVLTAELRRAFEAAADGAKLVCEGLATNNLRRDALAILTRSGVGHYAKPFHTLRKNLQTEWSGQYPQHVVCEWLGNSPEVASIHYLTVPEELYAPPSVQNGYGGAKNSEKRARSKVRTKRT